MYSNPLQGSEHAARLRKEAGAYVKSLRQKARLTQKDLAKLIGYEYYTFISQIESGKGRVPPEQYEAWARALGVPPDEFVKHLLQFYDPFAWKILFGQKSSK